MLYQRQWRNKWGATFWEHLIFVFQKPVFSVSAWGLDETDSGMYALFAVGSHLNLSKNNEPEGFILKKIYILSTIKQMKSLSLLSSSIAIGMSLYTCKCWILDCARPKFNRVVFLTIKSSQEYVNMSSPTLWIQSCSCWRTMPNSIRGYCALLQKVFNISVTAAF